ncbi:alpha-2-macroglobulin family protein [Amphritea sp. HPY]|uniref:alpha-2-macroglobulin family protein n=1 Tax=Amphritea sp. HPY TaxID=3421652 RepID=UPI003D7DBD6B
MLRLTIVLLVLLLSGCGNDTDTVTVNKKDTPSHAASSPTDDAQPSDAVQQSAELQLTWSDYADGSPVVRDSTSTTVDIYASLSSSLEVGGADLATMFAVSDASARIELSDKGAGHYDVVIGNISRDQSCAREISVNWDGGDLNEDFSGKQNFIVPAVEGNDRSPLQLLSSEIFPGDSGAIELVFNRNLKTDQALKHLISSSYSFTSYKTVKNKVYLGLNHSSTEQIDLTIHKELQDGCGIGLSARQQKSFSIEPQKPGVRFTGKGVILPDASKIELPFQAVSAKSVTITAFEVFETNIGQFLQENKLQDTKSLERVGRFIWQKSISLDETSNRTWKDYRLDVSELLNKQTGSLIRLYLSLDRGDSLYPCSDEENAVPLPERSLPVNAEEFSYAGGSSSWDSYEQSSNSRHNNNACKDSYFARSSDTKSAKNLLRSNIGIIAKQAPQSDIIHVTTTSLKTAQAIQGVQLDVFNFQGQRIGVGQSDKQGFAVLEVSGKPFYLQAQNGPQKGYIKLSDVSALTTSQFDIGGKHLQSNINGFSYGERDVWRPGDTIYLTFVLHDKLDELPASHPVVVDLFNPSGQLVLSTSSNEPVGNLYTFTLSTPEGAPTGNWEAIFRVGGLDFSRPLKIETVVPNRLKVETDIPDDVRIKESVERKVTLMSRWLHGAPAADLKAEVAVSLVPIRTQFAGKFPDYLFDDPAREYRSRKISLFEGALDSQGEAEFALRIESNTPPPGMLRAVFANKVYEEGGQFSINSFSRPFDFYDRYVGMLLPEGDAERGMLLTDEEHKSRFVVLDDAGHPVSNTDLEISVYKLSWKWWYEKSAESLARYADGRHSELVSSGQASTDENGQAEWPLRINYPDWGRYLVRACVAGESTHCTGKIVYIDWPGWAGRQQESQGDNVDRLTLYSDKKKYVVGDVATVSLPQLKSGHALVSVESANAVLDRFWVDVTNKQSFDVAITPAMTPNVYVSVTYLQPHQDRDNDRPMRLMGIVPVLVEDPDSHLQPVISTVTEVKPQASFEIEVEESRGRPMAYTLAIVDEGLLGLTNYKTPDPFDYFYQRQALQVKTWDIYKDVVGAYSGILHGLLPVGGSDSESGDDKDKKNRRFPPVVQFIGSFELSANESRTHTIRLPMYLGAVRVMVVAEDGYAYGKAEQGVIVRDKISVFPTLPRILRTQEKADVAVELFNNTQQQQKVQVSLDADVTAVDIAVSSKSVIIPPSSSSIVNFAVQTRHVTGKTAFNFTVASDSDVSKQTLHLDIKAPNAQSYRTESYTLTPDVPLDLSLVPFGIDGSNQASVALSFFKPINLKARLDYLIRYPHGCIEQTTSSVFPQLYLSQLSKLDDTQREAVQNNIASAIVRLQTFQTFEGGFAYWPGQSTSNPWGSSYAGHFLVLAKDAGYDVPEHLLSQWLSYQHVASNYSLNATDAGMVKAQAYRLYTLSLSGNPNWSAMYRLKALNISDSASLAMLSLAYLHAGQPDVAKSLIERGLTADARYDTNSISYGSELRDRSLFLLLYSQLMEPHDAAQLAEKISADLASKKWHSTQSTAFALVALAQYEHQREVTAVSGEAILEVAGETLTLAISNQLSEAPITADPDRKKQLLLTNKSEAPMWVTVTQAGIAKPGSEDVYAKGLRLEAHYLDSNGEIVDITKLSQGNNVTAEITVTNDTPSKVSNVALNFLAPSGWQIDNERQACGLKVCLFDYIDIRDDSVSAYMALDAGESKVLTIQFNASFSGHYYHPATSAAAMYDDNLKAQLKGSWVEVVK